VGIKTGATLTIKSRQTIVSPDPKITVLRLRDGRDRAVRQATLLCPDINQVVATPIFRRASDNAKSQTDEQQEKL
jgi:hypothetical protein